MDWINSVLLTVIALLSLINCYALFKVLTAIEAWQV
jgi:hypothetical protein